jgi:hypothetical protein
MGNDYQYDCEGAQIVEELDSPAHKFDHALSLSQDAKSHLRLYLPINTSFSYYLAELLHTQLESHFPIWKAESELLFQLTVVEQ